MANLTDFLENKILDHVLRGVSYSPTTPIKIALFTAAPGDAGGGTEVTGGSYARQTATFSAAASGSITTSADINFAGMPAATVTHIAIYDSAGTPAMLFWGALATPKTLSAGDTLSIQAGQLTVTLD